jgi:hypothetical protein
MRFVTRLVQILLLVVGPGISVARFKTSAAGALHFKPGGVVFWSSPTHDGSARHALGPPMVYSECERFLAELSAMQREQKITLGEMRSSGGPTRPIDIAATTNARIPL